MRSLHKVRLYWSEETGWHKKGYLIDVVCEIIDCGQMWTHFEDYEKALIYAKKKASKLNLELVDYVGNKKYPKIKKEAKYANPKCNDREIQA